MDSPTRALTFQEKVQRKRARNKTPTSSVTTTPESSGSPRRDQIKNQLAKAMGSSTSPSRENRPIQPSYARNGFSFNPIQHKESPLSLRENQQQGTQKCGIQQSSRYIAAEERKEDPSNMNGAISSRPKTPTRMKLPKWPPEPVLEETAEPLNEGPEKAQSQSVTEKREMAESAPSSEQSIVGSNKKTPWVRNTTPTSTANDKSTVNGGKPVWVRSVANEEEITSSETSSNGGSPWVRTGADPSNTSSPKRAPWARSRTPSPATSNPSNQQKPSWGRPAGNEQSQSEENATQTTTSSQPKRAPWSRSMTPSPSPSNASSPQKPSWLRSSVATEGTPLSASTIGNIYTQQKASWVRPSTKERAPSPVPSTADSATSQQTPSWIRPQQSPSPVPSYFSDGSQQKPSWARPQLAPSPVSSTASGGSQQKAPWVRSFTTEKTPSSPSRAVPWVRPFAEEQTSSQAPGSEHESENSPETEAAPRRNRESFVQRRMRSMKAREIERQASDSNLSVQKDELVGNSEQRTGSVDRSPRRNSPTKKWPPVRTQPFSNGYRQHQQQMTDEPVEQESSETLADRSKHEEQPCDPVPAQPVAGGSTSQSWMERANNQGNDEAKASALKKAPCLRTSPTAPANNDYLNGGKGPQIRPSPTDEVEGTDSLTCQQRTISLGRRTPSPVPTDEGNYHSSWAQAAARARLSSSAALSDTDKSTKQPVMTRSYKKPPPSPHFGTTKYVPPWVKSRENELKSDVLLEKESLQIEDRMYSVPSDEVNISSPPPSRPGRKQLIMSPPSPSRKILNEVKTRRVTLKGEEDCRGDRFEEVSETVVSYGGASIETPKSVNVACLGASLASGERFSSPPKSKSPGKDGYGAPPPAAIRHFSKQSTSPGEPSPGQPERPLCTAEEKSHGTLSPLESPEKPRQNGPGQWDKVHSPPPSWSRAAHASKTRGSQRELNTIQSSPPYIAKPPIGRMAPTRTPPPTLIKQDVPQGDLSSIKSLRWGSKALQSQESPSLDRSQPPSWINRDVSQGEMSSIKSPDWSSRQTQVKIVNSSARPPSWIDGDADQEELSPIASPQPSPVQRKVRITVETVDDESEGDKMTGRPWSPESHTSEYVYPAEEAVGGSDDVSTIVSTEETTDDQDLNTQDDFENEDVDEVDDPESGQYPQKSSSKSLAQMAMDSVFALDFDLVMAQAPKVVLLEDEEESFGSTPSKGIAKSTPPERELPDEVKAMLERSLNRSRMSNSQIPEDSAAYEADYFSTDVSESALDQSISTWNENNISALSHGSGLEPLSLPRKVCSPAPSSPQTNRALQFSTDESPVKAEESEEVPVEALESVLEMKSNDNAGDGGSSSTVDLGDRDLYEVPVEAKERAPRITEKAVEGWCGGRVSSSKQGAEPSSSKTKALSFTNFGPNESTIDLGNPTDFSIQVSPDSPRQMSLVGTSPALVSDSPPRDFASRKKVRFGGLLDDSDRIVDRGFGNEAPGNVASLRHVMEEWRNEKEKIDDPSPPPMDDGTSPPSSAGAVEVLKYFTRETPPEISRQDNSEHRDSEHRYRQDTDLGDMSEPMEADRVNGPVDSSVEWRKGDMSRPRSPQATTTWPREFDGQDPFSKQDAQDPFFRQDDPFAASKSASSDFASDFGDGFNPFADDPETYEAFDFEKDEQEHFSPYGDAPKGGSSGATKERAGASTPTRLTPSRRDVRRCQIMSDERYLDGDYHAPTQQLATTSYDVDASTQPATLNYEPGPSGNDEFVEYYAQHSAYTPTTTKIGGKDGTYLLEI